MVRSTGGVESVCQKQAVFNVVIVRWKSFSVGVVSCWLKVAATERFMLDISPLSHTLLPNRCYHVVVVGIVALLSTAAVAAFISVISYRIHCSPLCVALSADAVAVQFTMPTELDVDGDVKETANGHSDEKEVPPPTSTPFTLPPASARSQPTGFPSPPSSAIPSTSASTAVPTLTTHHNGILHTAQHASTASQHNVPRSVFSRTRLIAELQLGIRQVAGPTVAASVNGTPGDGSAHVSHTDGKQRREDEDTAALRSTFRGFQALSPALQSECLLFFLSDGALLCEILNWLLTTHAGHADDPVCQWLYELYWQATHVATNATAVVITTQALAASPPAASLFILHLAPILVFSFMYRTARSIAAPGIAAVLLGVYNTQRAQAVPKTNVTQPFIDPEQLIQTVYGAPAITLPPPPPVQPNKPVFIPLHHSQPVIPVTTSPAPGARPLSANTAAASLPVLSDLSSGASVSLLVHVVLSEYQRYISLLSPLSQQQFCYLACLLADNHSQGEIHRTLRLFDKQFVWTGDWEASMAAGGAQTTAKKHVTMSGRRGGDAEGEEGDEEEQEVEKSGPRYELTGQLMEDMLLGLTYCGCYPGTKQLALLGLRAVHCRAVEELNPQVLLQTTAILESVSE